MRLFVLVFALAGGLSLASAESVTFWNSRMSRGNGELEAQTFRVTRTPTPSGQTVETVLPARGEVQSRVVVELDQAGALMRSRTEYLVASLSDWYRADQLFTEVQPGGAEGDNLAFQRAWKNEVQEAKNLRWGKDFVEFSTLPFLLERRLAAGQLQPWQFQTYSADIPGTMEVTVTETSHPLDAETRYQYPRWLRERFGARTVLLVELNGLGNFKGAYPYPFFYAFSTGSSPQWLAAWGGSPQATSFQWREE